MMFGRLFLTRWVEISSFAGGWRLHFGAAASPLLETRPPQASERLMGSAAAARVFYFLYAFLPGVGITGPLLSSGAALAAMLTSGALASTTTGAGASSWAFTG
jgi:hypothetical protein